MIKFLVGISVVVFTTYCGRFFAKKYRLRKNFFQQAASFNVFFLEEISYSKRSFEELCARFRFSGEFQEVINLEISRRAQRKSSPIELDEFTFLSTDERAFFREYFLAIGRGDTQSQKGYFSNAANSLESFKNQAVSDCNKYMDLYTKLGFLLGLALLIFLV